MEIKSLWIRPLHDTSIIYKLYPEVRNTIELPGGDLTVGFLAVRYYFDEKGERVRSEFDSQKYIILESLLDYYTVEGSHVGEYINSLERFRQDVFDKNTSQNLEGFKSLFDNFKEQKPAEWEMFADGTFDQLGKRVYNTFEEIESDYNKIKNEGDKENIHTLHSGESETDPSSAPEGVQE